MFARVFDKRHRHYYKSIVYCIVNRWDDRQYVVLNPDTNCFVLVNHSDKHTEDATPLVEIIQDDHGDWKKYENAYLLKYKAYCQKHGKEMTIDFLFGYPDVCENYDFITAISERGCVPVNEFHIHIRNLADIGTWNYISTQADADDFMKKVFSFHDATLDQMVYIEQHDSTKAIATFDTGDLYGIVEICFEGIITIHLRSPKANCPRYIYEAALIVKDETVFWTDAYMEEEALPEDISYMKALNMKWRKIG